MTISSIKRLFLTIVAVMVFTSPAFALDLQSARSSGVIGEKNDGYVAVLKPSPEVNAFAAKVNEGRQIECMRISKENGQTIGVVAKVAAETIVNKISAGSHYQAADGSWKIK
jgi:uncharacterized protein YdbL (DUF1318 family)